LKITGLVSPTGVMGKSLSNREDSTSTGIHFCLKINCPQPFIKLIYDGRCFVGIVDVEDVASDLQAATTKTSMGKNYSCQRKLPSIG